MTLRNMTPLLIPLPPDLLAAIDTHRRETGDLAPRTEAIRRLIRAGLDATQRKLVRRKARVRHELNPPYYDDEGMPA